MSTLQDERCEVTLQSSPSGEGGKASLPKTVTITTPDDSPLAEVILMAGTSAAAVATFNELFRDPRRWDNQNFKGFIDPETGLTRFAE